MYGMCVFVVPNAKAPVIVIKIYREKKVQQEKKSEGKERINKYKIWKATTKREWMGLSGFVRLPENMFS